MIKRRYYGWLKNDRFYLSLLPPDSPSRPSVTYETIGEVKALLTRRGVEIYWSPPLPDMILAELRGGSDVR